jgi:hypothetical protein
MPGDDQRFDFRNLPAATQDSCDLLQTLGFDLLKGPAISVEDSLFARVLLISLEDTIRQPQRGPDSTALNGDARFESVIGSAAWIRTTIHGSQSTTLTENFE